MSGKGVPQRILSFSVAGLGPKFPVRAPQHPGPLGQQGAGRASASSAVAKGLEKKVTGERLRCGDMELFLPHQGLDS